MPRVFPGMYTTSTPAQDPAHALGARAEDHIGRVLTYGRALSACTVGQIVTPNLYATLTTGITAALSTSTFTSSGSSFTVRVEDVSGKITTWERPARGTILHVAGGTGKQQFARVTDVLTTTKLGVQVIGATDGKWPTALGGSDVVRLIEPLYQPYDIDNHTLPPVGYTMASTAAAGDFFWSGSEGVFQCKTSSLVEGTPMIVGATAGQIEPGLLWGSETWDVGSIDDGNELTNDVTVTGAALGDFATASLSLDSLDLTLTAEVTAANTVTAVLGNFTGAGVDVLTPDLLVRVDKKVAAGIHDAGTLISAPQTANELGLIQCSFPPYLWGHWRV